MNPQKTARVAGFLYLLMAPFAIFGLMYVPSTIIVSGDTATTAKNIMASELLFRSGIASALITQIIGILVVLALYRLLNSVNKTHAVLMVVFMLASIPIAMLSEIGKFAALHLLSGADYLGAFEANQVHTQVMFFLKLNGYGMTITSIFWSLWLFPMGYLVYKSGFLPRILGVALIIAGFGYFFDFFSTILFPNAHATIGQYTGWMEILFPLWLVIKGVNVEQWESTHLNLLESNPCHPDSAGLNL